MTVIDLPAGSLAHIHLKDGRVAGRDDCRLDVISSWIQLHSEMFNQKKVLDLGSNVGHFPIVMAQVGADVVAVEPRLRSVQVFHWLKDCAKDVFGDIEILDQDLRKLDLAGRRFDVVSTLGLIYHLERPWQVMSAILAQVKPAVWILESQLYETTTSEVEGAPEQNATFSYNTERVLRPTAEEVERGIRECGYVPERIDLGPTYKSENGCPRGFWVARPPVPEFP